MDNLLPENMKKRCMESNFYPIFLDHLKKIAETEYGNITALGRYLGVKKAAFHKQINGQSIPSADIFCAWIEKMGGAIFLPGEAPSSVENKECSALKAQIATLRELVESKEQIIRLLMEKK